MTSRFIYGTPGFEAVGIQAGVINIDGTISPVAGSPFVEGLGTPSIIQIHRLSWKGLMVLVGERHARRS